MHASKTSPRLLARRKRGIATFKQRDVTKAIRAFARAGLPVQRIEIDALGTIVIIPTTAGDQQKPGARNEWDDVK